MSRIRFGCHRGGGDNSGFRLTRMVVAALFLGVVACSDAGSDSLLARGGQTTSGGPSPTSPSTNTPGGSTAPTVVPANGAVLTWDAVTKRKDGTPLDDLTGYVVHYGNASRAYISTAQVTATTYTAENLEPGTYYFAVTAIDARGNESEVSEEVSKTIP